MRRTLAREDVLILLVGVRRKMANVGWDTLLLPAPHHLIDLVLRDSRPRVPLGGGGRYIRELADRRNSLEFYAPLRDKAPPMVGPAACGSFFPRPPKI